MIICHQSLEVGSLVLLVVPEIPEEAGNLVLLYDQLLMYHFSLPSRMAYVVLLQIQVAVQIQLDIMISTQV